MIFLYGYLGIGLATLGTCIAVIATLYLIDCLKRWRKPALRQEDPKASTKAPENHSIGTFDTIDIGAFIAFILVITVWPGAIYLIAKTAIDEIRWKRRPPASDKKREFAVEPQNLEERLSVQEIETREMVTDPLKAAPELPFGHMNAGWKEFLTNHNTNDELWSFSAVWQSDWDLAWGFKKLRSGYVIVKDGTPGPTF